MAKAPTFTLQLQHAVCSSDLDSDTRHLVMVMALKADWKTGVGSASQTTIADAMGCSVRHVGGLIRDLEASATSAVGVRRTRRSSATGRSSDQYELFIREPGPNAAPGGASQPAQRAESNTQPNRHSVPIDRGGQPAQRAGTPQDSTGKSRHPNRHAVPTQPAQRADDQDLFQDLDQDLPAPRAKRVKAAPTKDPAPGAHELKLHYVAEFERLRQVKPEFGPRWARAMKAFGELAKAHGLEGAKGLVSRALADKFTRRIQPWELVDDANKHLGPAPRSGPVVQRGGTVRESNWLDDTGG